MDYGEGPRPTHLGRDLAHWSYFVHSAGSPEEGNSWNDAGEGVFVTDTHASRITFSDADLYLMGAIPVDDVSPWFMIEDPDVGDLRDAFGRALDSRSPPEWSGREIELSGTRLELNVEMIVAAEGERVPDHEVSQKSFRMATIVITQPGGDTQDVADNVDPIVQSWERLFHAETRELLTLSARLDGSSEPTLPTLGERCDPELGCAPESGAVCVERTEARYDCLRPCQDDTECSAEECCADLGGEGACVSKSDRLACGSTEEPDVGLPVETPTPTRGDDTCECTSVEGGQPRSGWLSLVWVLFVAIAIRIVRAR